MAADIQTINLTILENTMLFKGIEHHAIAKILAESHAYTQTFDKGEYIYRMGEKAQCLGFILEGSVSIESDDLWGNHSVLDQVSIGKLFAENYALNQNVPLMVNVVAQSACNILFLNITALLQAPLQTDGAYTLLQNLLHISTRKSLHLSRRMFHTSPKTIRARLLSYLSQQAIETNCLEFDIVFKRQELADYLNVDRSAMSFELSKMQKEGLLQFHKNHFILHKNSIS
ncbi:MAG: Crp/Fnr family transcriptional regulator [Eubacteriales bacterium]|nr:Crp/Fnr family transcriptional regulator [Eubacteriales bacterium]